MLVRTYVWDIIRAPDAPTSTCARACSAPAEAAPLGCAHPCRRAGVQACRHAGMQGVQACRLLAVGCRRAICGRGWSVCRGRRTGGDEGRAW